MSMIFSAEKLVEVMSELSTDAAKGVLQGSFQERYELILNRAKAHGLLPSELHRKAFENILKEAFPD